MEQDRFHLKLLAFLILFFTFMSCENQSMEEKILDEAIVTFQYNQGDLLLEQIEFKGPILKDRIENFKPNPDYTVYAWYYTRERDTFWIYSKVDNKLLKKTTVHLSENFDILLDNRKNWK